MLKLKLQYFGHLMQRADSLEKILILGKIEGKKRRVQQRIRWLDNITNSVGVNLRKLQERVKDREACLVAVYAVAKSWTWLINWTTPRIYFSQPDLQLSHLASVPQWYWTQIQGTTGGSGQGFWKPLSLFQASFLPSSPPRYRWQWHPYHERSLGLWVPSRKRPTSTRNIHIGWLHGWEINFNFHLCTLWAIYWPSPANFQSLSWARGPSSQGYGFSSGHVWMWELDC